MIPLKLPVAKVMFEMVKIEREPMDKVPILEMTTREVLEQLERYSQESLNISAQSFVRLYEQGKRGCPGEYAVLLALVRLLPDDHPIFATE
jgi:hypothetical protein